MARKRAKDSWNREEVESLLKELSNDIDGLYRHNLKIDNWIKENL
jgi:hypothetical protein